MLRQLPHSPLLYTLVGGLCVALSLLTPLLWWLSLVGIWLYLVAISKTSSIWRVAGMSFLFWWLKAAAGIIWFWYANPPDIVESLEVGSIYVIIFIYWAGCAAALSIAGIVHGLLLQQLPSKSLVLCIVVPATWVLTEITNAYLFSHITIGGLSEPNSYFSFGYIGYTLTHHNWLFHTAGIAGVFGLSFISVCIGTIMYLHSHHHVRTIYAAPTLTTLLILTSLIPAPQWLRPNISEQTTQVAVVATKFSSADSTEYKRTAIADVISQLNPQTIDAILLPEDSRFFQSNTNQLQQLLPAEFFSHDILLIDSGRISTFSGAVLRGHLYQTKTNHISRADKQYLVPQGEFMPNIVINIMRLLGIGAVVEALSTDISYIPGPYYSQADFATHVPSILFCFESVSPTGVYSLLQQRAGQVPYIVHPISHAWFTQPKILWQQQTQMLRVQARWNNISILSAGNLAPSRLYLADGSVIDASTISAQYQNQSAAVYIFSVPTN